MTSPDQPKQFRDTVFAREDVRLDGNTFQRCQFGPDCRLIFRGEAVPIFEECHAADGVELVLGGAARVTLEFLSMLLHRSNGTGSDLFERVVNDLRRGAFEDHAAGG